MSNEWPIQQFHCVPAPSSFIEMMGGALEAMQQCAAVKMGEKVPRWTTGAIFTVDGGQTIKAV